MPLSVPNHTRLATSGVIKHNRLHGSWRKLPHSGVQPWRPFSGRVSRLCVFSFPPQTPNPEARVGRPKALSGVYKALAPTPSTEKGGGGDPVPALKFYFIFPVLSFAFVVLALHDFPSVEQRAEILCTSSVRTALGKVRLSCFPPDR